MAGLRTLIIEDFADFRRFILSILNRRPEFQVLYEASDGVEGVRGADELQPDLILLDIGLPQLNGIEAARRIREVSPNSRILFVSQESSTEVVQEALSLGADGYVLKSDLDDELLLAIQAVLGGQRFVSKSLRLIDRIGSATRHEILFCSDEDGVLDGLTRFIGAAIDAGDAAVVWATESHRYSLLQRLREKGVDVDGAIHRGTYSASDISEPPDPKRILTTLQGLSEAAVQAGKKHPRVAACGERAGHYWKQGNPDAALHLEQLFNRFAESRDIDILCIYQLPQSREDDAYKRICAEHTAVHYC